MKSGRIVLAALAAASVLPAVAGPYPDAVSSLEQYRYFPSEEYRGKKAFVFGEAAQAPLPAARDGFELAPGTGSQPSQHKYVLVAGKFAHSEECDHAIRAAKAPTTAEVEAGRLFSPGA